MTLTGHGFIYVVTYIPYYVFTYIHTYVANALVLEYGRYNALCPNL